VQVKSLNITPVPVKLGGNASISFSGTIATALTNTTLVSLVLDVKKQAFGVYITVPCIDGIGSCTYPYPCTLAPPPDQCPSFIVQNNIPCACPIAPGKYTLPPTIVTMPTAPSNLNWLTDGNYQVTATAKDNKGNVVACLWAQVSITNTNGTRTK